MLSVLLVVYSNHSISNPPAEAGEVEEAGAGDKQQEKQQSPKEGKEGGPREPAGIERAKKGVSPEANPREQKNKLKPVKVSGV